MSLNKDMRIPRVGGCVLFGNEGRVAAICDVLRESAKVKRYNGFALLNPKSA